MPAVILKDFPVKIDIDTAAKELRIRNNEKRFSRFSEIAEQAMTVSRPGAVYTDAFVNNITPDTVTLNETIISSRVMSFNLENVGRTFVYVVTSGPEIDEWVKNFSSMLERYWADYINELILYKASDYLSNYLSSTFELGKTGVMNPGSLPDWPLSGQVQLFSIIGNVEEMIGVMLTERLLLVPVKSLSGIIFPSDINYVNCMLCTREVCKGRRSQFNAQLYKEKIG